MPRRGAGSKATQPGTPLADNPVPNQTYGKGAEQRASMSAVPMAGAELNPQQGASPAQESAPNRPQPGEISWGEPDPEGRPITHGLPIGEGDGPEALHPIAQAGVAQQSMQNTLHRLASGEFGTPELKALAQFANLVGA